MAARTLILEATIEASVIHGTVTVASGERRPFYGWLEFNTAIEAALCETAPQAQPVPNAEPADEAQPAARAEPARAPDSAQLKRR